MNYYTTAIIIILLCHPVVYYLKQVHEANNYCFHIILYPSMTLCQQNVRHIYRAIKNKQKNKCMGVIIQ